MLAPELGLAPELAAGVDGDPDGEKRLDCGVSEGDFEPASGGENSEGFVSSDMVVPG
jgi:hypothetical protein